MARAIYQVVVHHAHRLHKRIDDSSSDKGKPALFEISAYPIGKRRVGGDFAHIFPMIYYRRVIHVFPDERVKAAELLLYPGERPRVLYGGVYLAAVADYFFVIHKLGDLLVVIAGDLLRVKAVERAAEVFTLFQYRYPRQPRLHTLEYKHLKEPSVVMERDPPFLIMIIDIDLFRARPWAATQFAHRDTLLIRIEISKTRFSPRLCATLTARPAHGAFGLRPKYAASRVLKFHRSPIGRLIITVYSEKIR